MARENLVERQADGANKRAGAKNREAQKQQFPVVVSSAMRLDKARDGAVDLQALTHRKHRKKQFRYFIDEVHDVAIAENDGAGYGAPHRNREVIHEVDT